MADIMAANSGGVEWSAVIKPLLCADQEASGRNDVLEVCAAIVKSQSEILQPKEHQAFFNAFAVLAADYITSHAAKVSPAHLEVVSAACRVLIRYLVSSLHTSAFLGDSSHAAQSDGSGGGGAGANAHVERALKAIHSLCGGVSVFTFAEIETLTHTMKGETPTQTNPTSTEKESSNKQDVKSRTDLSANIFEQLTMPIRDGDCAPDLPAQPPGDSTNGDPAIEINRLFLKANRESLQGMRAGDTLVDLCLSLPSIKKTRAKVEDALAGKVFALPANHAEATAVRNSLASTVAEITLVSSAINLPILEPLTPTKLEKLCNLSMSVLYIAVSQAAASSILAMGSAVSPKCTTVQSQASHKEDDLDSNAVTLVEDALILYSYIGLVIKSSTRAGGHVYQNYVLAGAWVLVSGLQSHVTVCTTASEKPAHLRDDKGRSPSKSREASGSARSGLVKFQHSFGVLSVALAARALLLLSELFEDLNLEVCGGNGALVQVEPAPISITGQYTASQRVAKILNTAPLNQLLFYLALVSYRKACTLKRHAPEGDTFSLSDSTTYYEDMILCSDVSSTDEDDDSEPLLGQWFEETLAPPEVVDTKASPTDNPDVKTVQTDRGNAIVPEKGEAHGFIILATSIFAFMNKHLLLSKSACVSRYIKTGITDQQIVILAVIIRDLDRETARTEVAAGQLYSDFSGALTRYTHNLVTHPSLQPLQASLLSNLGVSPWNSDVPHGWPLQVYARTLSVLAQVLLMRPQTEKEASVISIWHRLVNTLIENVINVPTVVEGDNEDLNVEHAQVLVYLFHSLNLMQKKSVVLLLAGGLLRCAEVVRGPLRDSQLLHLSRLLLLFDYIMKHLYDAPQQLLEQILFNLFYSTNLNTDKESKENNMSRMYTPWQWADNYPKISREEFTMKPTFYVLSNFEINNQDAPKLDGLACNFILGTPDKLRYPLLLDALIEILTVTNITSGGNAAKMTRLGLFATQYCFSICWKLLQLLPPSTPYLERLLTGEVLPAGPLLLHALIWGPRCGHKNFTRWLKDCLIKQGLYTQNTERLVKSVSDVVNTLKYDIATAKNCVIALTPDVKKGAMSKESLPPLWHLYLLHAVIAKVQVSLLDEAETNTADASGSTISGAAYVQELLPHVLRLAQAILHCTRWSLLHSMVEQTESNGQCTVQDYEGLQEVLAIATTKSKLTTGLVPDQETLLPTAVNNVIQQWHTASLEECTWTPHLNDIIVSESFILKIIDTHVQTLSSSSYSFSINLSLKCLLQRLMKFVCNHAPQIENTDTKNKVIELLVSTTLDVRTEFLQESVSKVLEKMIGDAETDEHQKRVYLQILDNTYKLITNYTNNENGNVNEKILHNFLKFYERLIEKSAGRQALEAFFTGDKDLVKVLMSVSNQQMSQQYSTKVLHFFNKLFNSAEKSPTDPSLNYLCSSMSKLANVDGEKLQTWLRHVIIGPTAVATTPVERITDISVMGMTSIWGDIAHISSPNDEVKNLVQENSQLLQALTNFIVKPNSNISEDVAITILKALLPLGTHILASPLEGSGFTDLMVVITMLADAGTGAAHIYLFTLISEVWLEHCKRYLTQKDVIEKLSTDPEADKNCVILDAACCMLDYMSDVINGILNHQKVPLQRPLSPAWENETPLDQDPEMLEEINDEEDSGEESDEDSLCNKLCTFTITQKEFMNQHWYHCHTCKMLDGVGVCSICARVCHKGHDVTYAKYGNFFCDCGAKEDASCQALVKRSPQSHDTNTTTAGANTNLGFISSEDTLASSLRKKEALLAKEKPDVFIKRERRKNTIVKRLDGSLDLILKYLGRTTVPGTLLEMLEAILPVVEMSCRRNSSVGCYSRAMKALQQLHSPDKKFHTTDQLMVPTLGSQEGAFENVRMSYAGEQGQTIRQLLSAHMIRRVTMCCMSSPQGKRQQLAVAHEKGKISVLQLSALLKQADSSTRKLTLTRLASAPIPFTVLSLTSNLCNDDYLAVCGLKDCHVLTFNTSGAVVDHLVLHPHLASGNFIIKAIWLPGSQTKLALITPDFVKIFDLAKDAISPQYYFLVPSGKIRDCTFMYEDGRYNILLMSSPGHIYTEALNEESSAKHGSFYVTNTLEVFHLDVTDVNGQVAGGGVSIYYSHTLALLFYSYAQGKSFVSPVTPNSNCLAVVFPVTLTSTSKSNGGKTPAPQPLCQWTEIPNHPGLICAVMQSSNNPVVLMLKPDTLSIQEVKVTPSKSKIMDMVAIRHHSGVEQRTTLILLCEDGSLKIYMANMDHTGYWMSPSVQTSVSTNVVVKPRKKKVPKTGKAPSSVTFPVDYFEHCMAMNDVEIGGNDLLQIYNVGQLKHRLNTNGLFVVCTKALGFSVEITNPDNNLVMTGIRVMMGTQDPQRAPTFIEIFGRIITTISITRSRWFDIPFSREESLQADKKLTITFGPSQDPETVTLLESIKVYGKTKDTFGWPEEHDDSLAPSGPSAPANGAASGTDAAEGSASSNSVPNTKLDKFVSGCLDILDGSFCLNTSDEKMIAHKSSSNAVATKLLTMPTPPVLQMHATSLLSSLYSSTASYHMYKDHELLQHVLSSLKSMNETKNKNDLDAESYYRLVMIVRGIAVNRPQNLVKFTDSHTSIQDVILDDPLDVQKPKSNKNQHLLLQLMDVLWLLHSLNPENSNLAPVVVPGLKHTEQVVYALVEIVHAFNSCDTYSNITIAVYLQLLLCDDPVIAFSAKHALSRVLKPKCKRRRVFIPSPPNCVTPPATKPEEEKAPPTAPTPEQRQALEAIQLLQRQQAEGENHNVNPLEAFLGGAGVFQPLLDITLDADDDTMVELAIALSLQEHELSDEQQQQALHGLQVLEAPGGLGHAIQEVVQHAQEAGHLSDTTASAGGSDDEGSTAATDGSTLRTSPAEQGGSAGSESGGSGVESITGEHNVSGRSSTYGDNAPEAAQPKPEPSTSSAPQPGYIQQEPETSEVDPEQESENSSRLHILRLQLLERLVEYLPKLKNITGVRAIPFFQVILQLTNDLDGHLERDKACLNALLHAIVVELQINKPNLENICERNNQREVQLVIMRLLSVLMTKWKASSTSKPAPGDNSSFVASASATVLLKADFITYCLKLLQSLLSYWKETKPEDSHNSITGNLLKVQHHQPPPDMSPIFLKQFVKGHASDIFYIYPQLLTEMALRLPYQVHKHSEIVEPLSVAFETAWFKYLCEYMMFTQVTSIRRLVRKLLLFICGSKDKYRQLRDIHALNAHMKAVKQCCLKGGFDPSVSYQHAMSLPYDTLVEMVEHLKACLEIATSRVGNWQKFCLCHNDVLPSLYQVSCILDEGRRQWVVYNVIKTKDQKTEGVAPTILQLLNCAIVLQSAVKKPDTTAKPTARKEREKSDDSVAEAAFEEASCVALVEQINHHVPSDILARFIRTFVLETNNTTLRWQAHSLICSLYKNSKLKQKEALLELLWQLWPLLPTYGRKAAQFVDLLGYFSLKMSQNPDASVQIADYVDKAVDVLRTQNELLSHHPNANLYAHMSQYVELEGFYLESDPCLVCNNPEVPMSTIKLSSIKVDSKFTTTTQIVKLLTSHTISRITIRIGDLKRTKMVRTVYIYYNNRSVQAVVELKNKPALWHRAKKVSLQSGQTEVKIEFPLPIVACNLMIEYADFYENIQASSETLQCPRCSAAVPANPGVCSNCGENVFQCHKCRAINYDEKDPFLCHACGFCKYAKFDFTLQAKSCCAVEPIENDDDRKKMVSNINTLLEKADRVYKQLMGNKPSLELLVVKVQEQKTEKKPEEAPTAPVISAASVVTGAITVSAQLKVNKTIQMIAQQYCNECRGSFEELSKIIQKVLVSRKELVAYDRKHRDSELSPSLGTSQLMELPANASCAITRCYGCATAATEHCLTLLRALAINTTLRQVLCSKGLIQELLANNLRKGSVQIQEDVRELLCILSKENADATEELCNLITERVTLGLSGQTGNLGVRHEIALLAALQQIQDDCWETRLRSLVSIFLKACEDAKNPMVIEAIVLPCLQIWHSICKPKTPETQTTIMAKKMKDKINNKQTTVVRSEYETVPIDVYKWVNKDPSVSYAAWRARQPVKKEPVPLPTNKEEVRRLYLSEKYANRWRRRVLRHPEPELLNLDDASWVKTVLFNPSSRTARQVTCFILEHCCSNYTRKKQVIKLLINYLHELSAAGENAAEYIDLFCKFLVQDAWTQYLAINGVMFTIADLITREIEQLHRLEETTLTSDLTQGYALNQLTEILIAFFDDMPIRRQFKSRLVGAVLNGYLSLRRLVVQRTRLIDETQERLLDVLEEITTGTEEETRAFMCVCMETVEKCALRDVLTPVFIFERLCSIIYPEENDCGEFFLTLEKDAQQEDFLQGRMLGNPYSSIDAGLGPLMRDVKNKICQDCELIALLEDDNGMELLVNNKIMSLDLPVKDVYKKVWLAEGGEVESMRMIYRMRGLLGDATEEFVETLNNKSQAAVDNEEVYKMANVLAECGGLKIMVTRLGAIQNVTRAKSLLQVLLKLFRLSVKVVKVQEILTQPEVGAMSVFLRTLQLCLEGEPDASQAAVTEQLLDIMETILARATSKSLESFNTFSQTFGGPEYVQSLLSCTNHASVRSNQAVLMHLTKVLAALVYGCEDKMQLLLNHFKPVLNFNKYDVEHTADDQQKLEMFCVLTDGIEKNAIGNTLKDYINELGVVDYALEYITMHAPCVKPTLLRTDSDELKEFISKPALKYILRFLTGMAHSHENTQFAVSQEDTIPIIHRLEQVSSDEHVGSLAENLLEALRTNAKVATKIEEVREFTRSEKKRLAMAMREKQLGQLGMRTNDKGQVTAKSAILQQMEELGEETGLVCCICREGYKYQPTKVLAIYTFTKRCHVEEFECKPRKTIGYNTVTHFNIVHVDCHMSAVRLARARDEWESAALQNANTKCNGLLPLWGPHVPESAFASCLARHNTYLQESTNHRDIGHASTVHDLKLLLLRFSNEKSFHEDTGGGGPQSNMHMVPYLIHMALYVINTTRVSKKEEANLNAYLEQTNVEKYIESSYESDGPLYWTTMSILLHSMTKWNARRLAHLNRLLMTAHVRSVYPSGPMKNIADKSVKDYSLYKPYLVLFGIVDGIYRYFFKHVTGPDDQWSSNLADYIRHNDEALLKGSERLLAYYVEELVPCTTFAEFCDVCGLLELIDNPDSYICNLLKGT